MGGLEEGRGRGNNFSDLRLWTPTPTPLKKETPRHCMRPTPAMVRQFVRVWVSFLPIHIFFLRLTLSHLTPLPSTSCPSTANTAPPTSIRRQRLYPVSPMDFEVIPMRTQRRVAQHPLRPGVRYPDVTTTRTRNTSAG